jgi:hypothetical protein
MTSRANREYHVSWEIEVYATSVKEAAKKALEIHRDLNSTANVFDVVPLEGPCKGDVIRVDLEEDR